MYPVKQNNKKNPRRQIKNSGADWLDLIDLVSLSFSLSRPPKRSPGEVRAAAFGWFPSLRGQAQGESNIQTHIKNRPLHPTLWAQLWKGGLKHVKDELLKGELPAEIHSEQKRKQMTV